MFFSQFPEDYDVEIAPHPPAHGTVVHVQPAHTYNEMPEYTEVALSPARSTLLSPFRIPAASEVSTSPRVLFRDEQSSVVEASVASERARVSARLAEASAERARQSPIRSPVRAASPSFQQSSPQRFGLSSRTVPIEISADISTPQRAAGAAGTAAAASSAFAEESISPGRSTLAIMAGVTSPAPSPAVRRALLGLSTADTW